MHELAIAHNLVEVALEAATSAQALRIKALHLRLGALSGVVKESLLFSYDIAVAGTALEGSQLVIEEVPIMVYCPQCEQTSVLPTIQSLRCPHCATLTGDIRQGQELELTSLEIEVEDEPSPYP